MTIPDLKKKVKNIPTEHLMITLFSVKLNYSVTGKEENQNFKV